MGPSQKRGYSGGQNLPHNHAQITVVLILYLYRVWRKCGGLPMKILKNINSSWPTHHGALRLLVAAASLTGMALAWAHGDHVTSAHLALGSHWN